MQRASSSTVVALPATGVASHSDWEDTPLIKLQVSLVTVNYYVNGSLDNVFVAKGIKISIPV